MPSHPRTLQSVGKPDFEQINQRFVNEVQSRKTRSASVRKKFKIALA
jgi:hypothetical protein